MRWEALQPSVVDTLDYQKVGEHIRESYREVSSRYRCDDEIEAKSENHKNLCAVLGELTSSFEHPITALDVGCGTGRYFHCLQNVQKLIGVDVSPDMLEGAKHPVLETEITIRDIELRCGNFFLLDLPEGSFDFIYSLGMFGHGCPVTLQVCNKFHDLLKPGGKLFFDTVDMAGLRVTDALRKRLRGLIYACLPTAGKAALDRRDPVPFFGMTKAQLRRILRKSKFARFNVYSRKCESPLWNGRHLECLALKECSYPE